MTQKSQDIPLARTPNSLKNTNMKIVIASDHAGLPLKEFLKNQRQDIEWIDVGTHSTESVDYPDLADLGVKKAMESNTQAVLICGSGQGMAMRANRHKGIRAALVWDVVSARLSREHNNANVLCLGARLLPFGLVLEILDIWLKTGFLGSRHTKRVEKLG